MRSGYVMRKWAAQEARDDQPCPHCQHAIGSHRGIPDACIYPDCTCHAFRADLEDIDDEDADESCQVCGGPAEDHDR